MKRILIALCTGSLLMTPPEMEGTKETILVTSEAAQAEGQETHLEGEASGTPEQNLAGTTQETTGRQPENPTDQQTAGPEISAPSAVLMEASTGKVIYEKDADKQRRPASITKIMTLILIFDAIDSGKIKLTDEVVTSAYAKSMGGSQVFLEEGEIQTVETLIKCIVVASGNDASVAMAEYISGTEGEFVKQMNDRAAGLGMTGTHFEDCCGLTDSPTHVTTARDIAVMSRELITKYPQIHNYSMIWMENITHVTKQGTKEFGLSNTNKLLKMATGYKVTGLKTGSTSLAKYCLSATAEKDGVRLIASIMAAPDYKARFADAQTLLSYGYANCTLYEDQTMPSLPEMMVLNGVKDHVTLKYKSGFSYLGVNGEDFQAVEKKLMLPELLEAPVKAGDTVGVLRYELAGKALGEVEIMADEAVEKAGYKDYFMKALGAWLMKAG
ncbi:MAG: D-alanyl-D-alanine carboxypeptidase [Lachnospiraceae bacterium]|jgi:D-alanyl-D-alanine carboxypeptidase (penicillin-binding protein 5/6)|nr:D-alanyl-D-alanine carboxypeptidase [Lachnospiraceae bacterium]